MHRERKLAALRRALKDQGQVRGAEASFFCQNPKGCAGGHHKPKLQVNLDSDVFHCWVCDWGGRSLAPIFRLLPPDDPDRQEYDNRQDTVQTAKVYDEVRLPKEFRPLCLPRSTPYYSQAIGYMDRRGIHSELIQRYFVGYCEEGRYAERIIVPSFDEFGELNFFVGRAVWERVGLPYLHGKFDKDIIFNDIHVDWSQPIVLVEGVFDAFKAGTNAIPLLGKYMGKKLKDKIAGKQPDVYVALDADALKDSLRICQELIELGVEPRLVRWPEGTKDPGDMTQEEFKLHLARARPMRNSIDFLRIKAAHSASFGHT